MGQRGSYQSGSFLVSFFAFLRLLAASRAKPRASAFVWYDADNSLSTWARAQQYHGHDNQCLEESERSITGVDSDASPTR